MSAQVLFFPKTCAIFEGFDTRDVANIPFFVFLKISEGSSAAVTFTPRQVLRRITLLRHTTCANKEKPLQAVEEVAPKVK